MQSRISPSTDSTISNAAAWIRQGGVAAFPTETVYGLGANALDARAAAQIFELKGRPQFDPLIVHVATTDEVDRLADQFPNDARKLAREFWPGPLTVVLPKRSIVPDIVTSGLPSVAVRVPDHPVALALIRAAGVPVAAPSANLFGRTSPTTAEHVIEQFGDRLEYVLDGGPCRVGLESTIVSFPDKRPLLLRPGGVPLEELEAVIGPVDLLINEGKNPLAPGRLPHHYAPRTPLRFRDWKNKPPSSERVGLLSFTRPENVEDWEACEVLSPSGDMREAAANLFASMRRLDSQGLELILADPVPEVGLGRAIMDRLRRASVEGYSSLSTDVIWRDPP